MRTLIVVPARFASTRLPGKPLIPIAGRTLLSRVVAVAQRAAALAGNAEVLVAVDDVRVAAHAATLGCAVAMTDPAITTGSGRVLAAAADHDADILVNLQGDAPFTPPPMVAELIAAMRAGDAAVATPVVPLGWDALDALRGHKQVAPFSGTTCIRGANGRAIWFSKAIVPAIRGEAALRERDARSPVLQHVGLYAYRRDALARFEAAPPSAYERLEGLEQLRFLELGMAVQLVEATPPRHAATGIDTAEDVARAERLIAAHGDPFDA